MMARDTKPTPDRPPSSGPAGGPDPQARPGLERTGRGSLRLVIGIIVKDGRDSIARLLADLAGQSLFDLVDKVTLIVLANGCSDDTAAQARLALRAAPFPDDLHAVVHETPLSGKSRSWNMLVHAIAPDKTDLFLFMDADIAFADNGVCEELIVLLHRDAEAVASTGRPTKSYVEQARPSWLQRLSLLVSEESRVERAINGSLYCLAGDVARAIWLPDQTPGEDGFLNAMVQTQGFSRPADARRVAQAPRTTHFYEASRGRGLFRHEQRMIVGTTINRWLFEYFWSLKSAQPVGRLISRLNREEPDWVERIVASRTRGKRWVVSGDVVFGRLPRKANGRLALWSKRVPLGLAVTLANFPACLAANGIVRRRGASRFW